MASQHKTSLIIEGDASGGMVIKAAPALKQAQHTLNQTAQEAQAQLAQLRQQLSQNIVEQVTSTQQKLSADNAQLRQILQQTTAAIEQQRQSVQALGHTANGQASLDIAMLGEQFNTMQSALTSLSTTIDSDFLGSLAQMTSGASNTLNALGEAKQVVDSLNHVAAAAKQVGEATLNHAAATRETMRYQAALGKMAGASKAATIAQTALVGAASAARGAMALMGGPAGIAIMAGYALYELAGSMETSAERAEKQAKKIDSLTERVRALRGETDTLTEAQRLARIESLEQQRATLVEKSNVDRLIEKRAELYALQEKLREQGHSDTADQVQQSVDNLNRQIAGTVNLSGGIADIDEQINNLKKGHDELNESVTSSDSAYDRWLTKTKDGLDPLREVEREMELVWKAFNAGDLNGDEVNKRIEQITESLVKNSEAGNDAGLSYSEWIQQIELVNRVGPENAKRIREIKNELHQLYEKSVEAGGGTDQYRERVSQLNEELAGLQPKAANASNAIDEFTNRAKDRLDDIGGQLFRDIFDDGVDSFENFADSVEEMFKDLIAEMTYMWFKSAIFSDRSQGGLGLGSIMNFAQGDSSGGGAAGGLGGLAGLGSGLGDAYNYIFGAKEAAATSGGLGASGGTTMTSASTAGFALFASYLASQAIDSLGESSGAYDAIGVDTQSTLAQIGSIFGPIGTIQGSWIDSIFSGIGFDIDKTFGSKRKPKVSFKNLAEDPSITGRWVGDETDAGDEPWYSSGGYDDGNLGRGRTTAFGSFGFTYKEMYEPADLVKVLDSFEQMDNAISSLLSEDQIGSVKSALNEFEYSGKQVKGVIASRLTEIIKSIDSDYVESIFDVNDNGLSDSIYHQKTEDVFTRLISGLAIENVASEMGSVVAEQMFEGFQEAVNSDITNKGLKQLADQFSNIGNTILTLDAASKQLGFTFDVNTEKTYDIAESINQAMGGLGNLQAAQTAYYQNYFSEEERRADTFESLKTSLTDYFDAIDVAMPKSKAAFRALVESLDATTDSGSEAYVALMQIQGQAAQYYQLLAQQHIAEQQRIAAFQLPDSMTRYLQDVNRWASQELENINQRMAALKEELRLGKALHHYVQDLNISERSPAGPGEKLSDSQAQFAQLLVAAEHGDMEAAGQLQQSANTYLDQADDYYGRSQAYSSIFNEVSGALDQLGFELINGHESEEQINQKMLYEQRQVRSHVAQELEWAQRQYGELANVSALLDRLPDALSSSLSALLPDENAGENPNGGHSNSNGSKPSVPSRGSVVEQQVKALYRQYGQEYNQDAEYWTSGIKEGQRTLDQLAYQLWIDQAQSSKEGQHIASNIRSVYRSAGVPVDEDGFNYWFSEIFKGNANFDDLQYGLLQDSKAKIEDYIRELAATYVRSSELNYQVDWWSDRLESGEGYQSVIRDIIAALNRSNDFEWVKAREYWESRGGIPGVNGSHRHGLASVPFDGYRAELHQAEMVLPAPLANHVRNSVGQSSVNIQPMVALLESLQSEVSRLTQLVGASADQAGRQREQQIKATQQAARHARPTPVTVG